MTKRMKDYKGVKYSSAHVTPDCESVRTPRLLNQLNLPNTLSNTKQEGGNGNAASVSGSAYTQNNSKGDTENKITKSNVQSGNSNSIQNITQHNESGKNIYAQTVNIYECPKEIIELIKNL
jgi:hypothetical protein